MLTMNYAIKLSDEFVCDVKIVRLGQEAPHVSDEVVVKATVFLPNCVTTNRLPQALTFGERACVYEKTWGWWGDAAGDKRHVSRHYAAATWAEAFEVARAAADAEIGNLVAAIQKRAQALRDAEL